MLSLRSIIMFLLILAIQPTAIPSLMSLSYTRPSTRVSILANEAVLSTADFVGTATVTIEIVGSLTVPTFSAKAFLQFTDYEAIMTFVGDLSPKGFVQSIIGYYESIKAFAQGFHEKRETYAQNLSEAVTAHFERFGERFGAYTHEVSNVMTAKFEAFNEKYGLGDVPPGTSFLALASMPTFSDIQSIPKAIFDKCWAPSPLPPTRSLGVVQLIATELFDAILFELERFKETVESFAKDLFASPPPPQASISSIAFELANTAIMGAFGLILGLAWRWLQRLSFGAIMKWLHAFMRQMGGLVIATLAAVVTFANVAIIGLISRVLATSAKTDFPEMEKNPSPHLTFEVCVFKSSPLWNLPSFPLWTFVDLSVLLANSTSYNAIAAKLEGEEDACGDDISDDPCIEELCSLFARASLKDAVDPSMLVDSTRPCVP